uniref:terminal uridylyltransferase 7-like n=1 Tax=Arvicanthis niloticus TaxID=61156 RepID=UPI0014861DDD|nr:terminal uridylyltransferase 7-like [Arvicanthis niloticus]
MGDTTKPYFVKLTKDRRIIDNDFRRGYPQQDYLIMDGCAKGHRSKMEKGHPRKKSPGNYRNTPRKGLCVVYSNTYAFKNRIYSQPAWMNDNHKDQNKKWLSDELAGNADTWRKFKPGPRIPFMSRSRKESFQESDNAYRWLEGRGCRTVRRLFQKDLTSLQAMSEMEAGSPESKKQCSRPCKPQRTRMDNGEQDGDLDHPVIDESVLSTKELLDLQQAEERLKRDCIDRLKRRPRNYPTAKYTCKLCDALIDSIPFAHKHIEEKRHKKKLKEKQEEELLTTLPAPAPSQIHAVCSAIDRVVQEFGLHSENLDQRLEIKLVMESVIQNKLPDCSLRLYGSSCSRLGFRDSDVNIDVQFPTVMSQPDVLLLVQECLKNSDSFIDVKTDFHAGVPLVVCRDKQSGLLCKVSAGNENAWLTTKHLTALGKLEPRLVPLVIAFRYWAKLCSIDHPEEGGLPPSVFALMAVFFLQQRKEPLLPVYLGSWIEEFSLNKLGNFSLKDIEKHNVVWEYTDNSTGDTSSAKEKTPKETAAKKGQVPLTFNVKHLPSVPVGQLWVELLRFYALEFNLADLVISIRVKELISRESKNWPKKCIAIEDPYSVKRNVAETLNSQTVFEYILHCLRTTYKYFALPHKITKPNLTKPPNPIACVSDPYKEDKEGVANEHQVDSRYTGSGEKDTLSEDDLAEPAKGEDPEECGKHMSGALLIDLDRITLKEESFSEENSPRGQSEFFYEFRKLTFTKGESPPVACSLCKRKGHLKKDCPEDFKRIQLEPLPPMTPKFSNILDQVCIQCYKHFFLTIVEDQAREHIRQSLESFIKKDFPGAKLSLFGSSKNGFGFKRSDLDICMTINGCETAEELDCVRTIEELAQVLRKHSGLRDILTITTAKVPIVKFFHLRSGLEVDISLHNTLALHNTKLLSAYSAIDPRVKYLCYTMKVFTKMCDISDASRGRLSSYAYTLMVLYFLQQRSPPVIPVLQEIYKGEKKPEILVDGWNVYFFDQMHELPTCWPEYGKNTESVGQLWLGLLRFYTEEFDFKEHVISIRRKSLLTTFKKQWTSKYISIEDPFHLNHNLGAGLSMKMTNFIMKAFINGRRVFGIPVKGVPNNKLSKLVYFFDPDVLTEGEPTPNDRCCRICGKIGHFIKDCPMREKMRQWQDQEDTPNQRYSESKETRSKEDKEIQKKYTEKEMTKEDKPTPSTAAKAKPVRAIVDLGQKKLLRTPAEKWKRQDDRNSRKKHCFICGREGHIKRECPQFKVPSGNLSSKYMTQGRASVKMTQPESWGKEMQHRKWHSNVPVHLGN